MCLLHASLVHLHCLHHPSLIIPCQQQEELSVKTLTQEQVKSPQIQSRKIVPQLELMLISSGTITE